MEDKASAEELLRLRGEIDSIDRQVLALVSRRAQLAHRIGQIKQGVVYRPEREAQVLRNLAAENTGPLSERAVKQIFREIMSYCLALEQPLKVGYMGPQGTYSESAALKQFGSAPNFVPLSSIDEVFREVEAGTVDYGVVPVENSTEGAVGRTLDLFLSSQVQVCGEVTLRVHHQLMSIRDSLEGVQRVYSHAQSLGQCHEWLNRNLPGVARVAVVSNAEAAKMAAGDPESCAIAGEAAAAHYGLKILAARIEDDPKNTTRFLVLSRHDAGPSGRDKTSLVCSSANRPGAMHELLAPLARHGVSMTKLESRPSRAGLWEYVFYMDIDGHQQDPAVAAALAELREKASFVKVLGSYPVAAL